MATKRVDIILAAKDEASKVIRNLASGTLPALVKGVGALATAYLSFSAAQQFVAGSFREFGDSEKRTRALTAAVAQAGLTTEVHVKHLLAQADALAKVSTADDEAIVSAQKVLISLGNLAGNGLDRATAAAVGLAAKLGVDVVAAAEMLAKAAQGSFRELSRYSKAIRDAKTDSEKFEAALQLGESGMMEAKAATEGLEGSTTQLSKSWHNFQEKFGEFLVKGLNAPKVIGDITTAVDTLTESMNKQGGTKGFIEGLLFLMAKSNRESLIKAGFKLPPLEQFPDTRTPEQKDKDARAAQDEEDVRNSEAWVASMKRGDAEAAAIAKSMIVIRSVQKDIADAAKKLAWKESMDPTKTFSPTITPAVAGGASALGGFDMSKDLFTGDLAAAHEKRMADAEAWVAMEEELIEAERRYREQMELTNQAFMSRSEKMGLAVAVLQAMSVAFVDGVTAMATSSAGFMDMVKGMAKAAILAVRAEMLVKAAREIAEAFIHWPYGTAQHLIAAGKATAAAAIASAAAAKMWMGGRVPGTGSRDSFHAILTPGERVLNRRDNENFERAMSNRAAASAGGSTISVTINAVDGESIRRLFRNNPREMAWGIQWLAEERGL